MGPLPPRRLSRVCAPLRSAGKFQIISNQINLFRSKHKNEKIIFDTWAQGATFKINNIKVRTISASPQRNENQGEGSVEKSLYHLFYKKEKKPLILTGYNLHVQ